MIGFLNLDIQQLKIFTTMRFTHFWVLHFITRLFFFFSFLIINRNNYCYVTIWCVSHTDTIDIRHTLIYIMRCYKSHGVKRDVTATYLSVAFIGALGFLRTFPLWIQMIEWFNITCTNDKQNRNFLYNHIWSYRNFHWLCLSFSQFINKMSRYLSEVLEQYMFMEWYEID